jgi:hypothetical protein
MFAPAFFEQQVSPSGGAVDVRSGQIQNIDLVPYLNRDFAQTNTRPMPLNGSWADQVNLETEMRKFPLRGRGGEMTSTRNFVVPLSWSMTPLIYNWQRPDNLAWHQEHSRMESTNCPLSCNRGPLV